jgi:hypothetical protein
MRRLTIAVAALALSAAAVSQGLAQDANAPRWSGGEGGGRGGAVRQACAADFARLCANVDRSAMRQCIKDNFDQLSDTCKSAITAMRAAHQPPAGGETPASH